MSRWTRSRSSNSPTVQQSSELTKTLLLTLVLLLAAPIYASDAKPSPDGKPYFVVELPADQRQRFRNPDGSCVQCSISMCGVAQNIPSAENLLWDTPYGPKVRGGSDPDRVKQYCDARHIAAFNVAGSQAVQWIEWALRNGRPCAITWGYAHMITAVGFSGDQLDKSSYIAVCDNNSPQRIDWVPYARFVQQVNVYSGGWVVILRTPPPAGRYVYYPWWEDQGKEKE